MATKLDQAISGANALIGIMKQLKAVRLAANDFVTQYTSEGFSTTWGAMATAAVNADGSLGTADGTPTAGHPIDNRVTNLGALATSVTAAQLVAGVTALLNLQKYFTNQAVGTANYNVNIDDLAS